MAKIYYRRIKAGIMTIEEVPERWRAAVQAMLDEDDVYKDTHTLEKDAEGNITLVPVNAE